MSLMMTRYSNFGAKVIATQLPEPQTDSYAFWLGVADSDETPVSQGRFGANFTSDVGMQPLNDASYTGTGNGYGKSYVAQSNATWTPATATLYDKYIKSIARLDTIDLSDRTCEIKLNRNRLWDSSTNPLPSMDYDTDGYGTFGTYHTDTLWDINFEKDKNFSFVNIRIYQPLECKDPDNFPLFKVELFDTIYSASEPLQTWNFPSDAYWVSDEQSNPWEWWATAKVTFAQMVHFQISEDNLRLMGNRWQNPSLKLTMVPEGGWTAGEPKFNQPVVYEGVGVDYSVCRIPSMLPDATTTVMNATAYTDEGTETSTTNMHDALIVDDAGGSVHNYWGNWVEMHPVLDSSSNPQPSKVEVEFEKPYTCPTAMGYDDAVWSNVMWHFLAKGVEGKDSWETQAGGIYETCGQMNGGRWNHYQAVPAYTFWDDTADFKGICFNMANAGWDPIGDRELKVQLVAYSGQPEERVIFTRYRKSSVTNPYNAEWDCNYGPGFMGIISKVNTYNPITKAEWMNDSTTDMTHDEQDNLSVRFELSGFDFTTEGIPGGITQYVDTPLRISNVLLFMQPTSTMSVKFGGTTRAFGTEGDGSSNNLYRARAATAAYFNIWQYWLDKTPSAEVEE